MNRQQPTTGPLMETPLEVAKRTGIWWSDPWWEGADYQQVLPLAEIKSRIEHLTMVFDQAWMRRATEFGPPNAVIPLLLGGRGLWPFQDIMSLGRTIRAIAQAPGFHRKVSDLIGEKSHATLFECQAAELIGQDKWRISFPAEAEYPTPDIVGEKDGGTVSIECKRLEPQGWEKWARNLGMSVITAPLVRQLDKCVTNIEFDQRLTELLTQDEKTSDGLLAEVAERVASLLSDISEAKTLPATRRIEDVVSVSVDHYQGDGHQGAAGGIGISPHAKARRIMHKVLEALPQVSSSETGVVAVFTDYIPSAELIDLAMAAQLRAHCARFANLAHVLVLTHSTVFEVIRPVLWSHPNPKAPKVAQAVLDTFEKSLPLHRGDPNPTGRR